MSECQIFEPQTVNIPHKQPPKAQLRVPRRMRQLQRTQTGELILNESNLALICDMEGLYEYPQMNKKIYLHYKVIQKITSLQKYYNLKTIYLENNVIKKIEGLGCLIQLENLFLHNNMIKNIQNLEKLKELKILNLSNNNIFMIEGLSELVQLQNLNLHRNYLSNFQSLEHLGQCSVTLTSIDLSDNQIVPHDQLLDLIPQIKCLYLSGNPLVKETNHYRRTIIGKLLNLLYLDQRGVDKQQRILAQAWIKQGDQGFRKAREVILSYRKQMKQERREEIMKDIDVHRKNKINVFSGNIHDAEKEIVKLRGYMNQQGNQSQIFFYQSRISQMMHKIQQNQQFIDSLYKRMGFQLQPPVYTIPLQRITTEEQQRTNESGQMFQIRQNQEQNAISASDGDTSHENISEQSQQSGNISNSVSSNSQEDSLKTYNSNSLQELD